MNHVKRGRSISYAPRPVRRSRGNAPTGWDARGQWTLCRKFESFPVRDNAMLQLWTEQGRVRPSDYLVSLERDLCIQARDVTELEAIFRKTRSRVLGNVWRGTTCAAIVLAWAQPLLGAALLLGVIVASTLCGRTIHRLQTFSLCTRDRTSYEGGKADCDPALARPV
jgi:hypothetical protein